MSAPHGRNHFCQYSANRGSSLAVSQCCPDPIGRSQGRSQGSQARGTVPLSQLLGIPHGTSHGNERCWGQAVISPPPGWPPHQVEAWQSWRQLQQPQRSTCKQAGAIAHRRGGGCLSGSSATWKEALGGAAGATGTPQQQPPHRASTSTRHPVRVGDPQQQPLQAVWTALHGGMVA